MGNILKSVAFVMLLSCFAFIATGLSLANGGVVEYQGERIKGIPENIDTLGLKMT